MQHQIESLENTTRPNILEMQKVSFFQPISLHSIFSFFGIHMILAWAQWANPKEPVDKVVLTGAPKSRFKKKFG